MSQCKHTLWSKGEKYRCSLPAGHKTGHDFSQFVMTSSNPDTIRTNAHVKQLRREAYEKYGGRCGICGSTINKLTFHHLAYPDGKQPSHWGVLKKDLEKYPSLLVLLCMRCHKMVEFLLNPEWRKLALDCVELTDRTRTFWLLEEVRRTQK